ncbi:MAG: chromosome segregation protein SMC, partial [Planctomycetota bacterium]
QSYHPEPGNPALFEWKRKNIENYLLVPEVWKRAVLDKRNETVSNLVNQPILEVINDFFVEQNLTLPKGKTWRNVSANIFSEVNGKKILFEQVDSLFQRISIKCGLKINRETLSNNFKPEELHQDVIDLFDMLATTLGV